MPPIRNIVIAEIFVIEFSKNDFGKTQMFAFLRENIIHNVLKWIQIPPKIILFINSLTRIVQKLYSLRSKWKNPVTEYFKGQFSQNSIFL